MKQIKIQCNTGSSLPLDAFIEFQGDLKELSKENYQKLKKEIEKTGFAFAPHVWKSKKDNKIAFYLVDGHQRIRTLRQMVKEGYECGEIPVVMVEAASMKEAKRRVLQGTSQYGRMTNDGLYEFVSESELEFQDVEDSFRLPDINFVDFKDEFLDDPKIDEAADEVPELRPDPKVKLGDLFILGNHRLLCGDSTNAAQVERLMNREKADMVFTDPPYNLAQKTKCMAPPQGVSHKQLKNSDSDKNFQIEAIFNLITNSIANDCSVYVCTSHFLAGSIWGWMELNFDFHSWMVWTKPNPAPSLTGEDWTCSAELICYARKGKHTFNFPKKGHSFNWWNIPTLRVNRVHLTQKPVELSQHAIIHSSNPNHNILDLFGGSGSTLIACEKTNRKCFMMELDPQYCQVIIERWQKYTNKEAVREDGVKFNALLLQD